MTVREGFIWLTKAAAVYAALTAGSITGGMIFYRGVEAPAGFDAAAAQQVLFIINAAYAAMLAALAARTRLSRIGTGALLFALFFGVQTLLTQMEAVYFAESLNYSLNAIPRDTGMGALTAFVGAAAAAMLFARRADETELQKRSGKSLLWRFALATALYPVAYWLAGLFIALQSEAVRDFYGAHIDLINPAALLAFQILRGVIWAGLAMAAVYGLRGPRLGRAILVGAAFAVFMAAQLFYPNPLMPETVRMVHLVEIGISNFVYGLVAALLLALRLTGRGHVPDAKASLLKA
jgi:hypothetical protein